MGGDAGRSVDATTHRPSTILDPNNPPTIPYLMGGDAGRSVEEEDEDSDAEEESADEVPTGLNRITQEYIGKAERGAARPATRHLLVVGRNANLNFIS